MGRVKIVLVKKIAEKLVDDYPGKFTQDFEENKKVVGILLEVRSKKLRNLVAGHVTRLVALREAAAPKGVKAAEEAAETATEAEVEEVAEKPSETPSGGSVRSPSPP
ncbi:MAG: 30S ribosomal protein S17e [Candidatus Bathyarchaeia archaeon]